MLGNVVKTSQGEVVKTMLGDVVKGKTRDWRRNR